MMLCRLSKNYTFLSKKNLYLITLTRTKVSLIDFANNKLKVTLPNRESMPIFEESHIPLLEEALTWKSSTPSPGIEKYQNDQKILQFFGIYSTFF